MSADFVPTSTHVNRMLRRALALAMFALPVAAQDSPIARVELSVGRSLPITTSAPMTSLLVTPETMPTTTSEITVTIWKLKALAASRRA